MDKSKRADRRFGFGLRCCLGTWAVKSAVSSGIYCLCRPPVEQCFSLPPPGLAIFSLQGEIAERHNTHELFLAVKDRQTVNLPLPVLLRHALHLVVLEGVVQTSVITSLTPHLLRGKTAKF